MWRDLAQPSHLLILALLVAVLFGWKRLPDMARSLGRSMRIFKSEVSEMKNDGKAGRPSPAAADTVPGDVVPPRAADSAAPAGTSAGDPRPAAGAAQPAPGAGAQAPLHRDPA
jgi:sec-independent protein translocase protein TatA